MVYFTATLDDPRQSHLYAVPLAGGEPRRITAQPGMHTVVLDHACRRFIDTHSAIDCPPSVRLRSLADGSELAVLHAQRDPRIDALGLRPPDLVTLDNPHGDRLYGAVFYPPAAFGSGPYPTVVYVYGGPHKQMVANSWELTIAMRPQLLCSLGFLVFVLDNRGSARRGLRFESPIQHDMGHAEVEDQVDGVRWLVKQGLADPQRVGVYGWSYGGYMALMCLARAPETFQVAVAGAPVTHWDGYDTHYTERYMAMPQNNPDGYQDSSVMAHIPNLRGDLMITHGLIDENVHFRHTARLINALNRAHKPYELLIFPDERHMPRRLEDRVYMEERIVRFLKEHLIERSE
jgi:dipeptidyl-peptidase-4